MRGTDTGRVRPRQAINAYCIAAGVAGLLTLWLSPLQLRMGPELFLLPGLALLAEFMPVQLSRRGIRITFTLPYVAGMAIVSGPSAALVLECAVTASVALAVASSGRRRVAKHWIAANVAIAVLCCAVGGLVLPLGGDSVALQALAFTLGYASANLGLVALLDCLLNGRLSEKLLATLRLMLQGVVLYALVAVAVAVLIHDRLVAWTAFTIVPIFTLRAMLLMQTRMYEQYYETITALTLMLQRAHPYTHGHLERVSKVSEEVALKLGLSPSRARLVREAAVLHDIGKIAVDEEILDQPRKLTPEEMDHVRRHSALGAEILGQVPQFKEVSYWILHHHERPDGNGYPLGLADDDIPIESKIIAAADAFDAMTGGDAPKDHRSYKQPMSRGEALAELDACAGSQFDPAVVRAFREVLTGGSSS
jgi:putative nucleotidyltransferase with HDIG domain